MPHPRKNKCRSGQRNNLGGALWFTRNVLRQRRREEIASESRKRNRKG